MEMKAYKLYFIHMYFYIIIVVAFLMSINTLPAVQVSQPATPLTNDNICTLAQRIVQMTQAYGNARLTNGNGTNFWDQFVSMAVLIASHCRVYIYIYIYIYIYMSGSC